MRSPVDPGRLTRLLKELGHRARGPGRIYLTGGATALLHGWRDSTVDVDLKLDPEPAGIFEAIAKLKEELDINIELASPDQFLPPVPGWQDRSEFLCSHGEVDFFHFDLVSQCLAKLSRAHDRDMKDVEAMLELGLVSSDEIASGLRQIEPTLLRYPGLDAAAFSDRVRLFLGKRRD